MTTQTTEREARLTVGFWLLGTFAALTAGLYAAAANLGISASLATLVYYALEGVAWGATAAAAVAGLGLGAFGAQLIWQAVKRYSLKTFVTW